MLLLGLCIWAYRQQSKITEPRQETTIEISFAEEDSQTVMPIMPKAVIPEDTAPQPLKGTPQKLNFEEYCRRNPISTCWNQQKPEDFLYEEETAVAVIKPEEFSPELLETLEEPETVYEEDLPEDIIEPSDVYTAKIYSIQIIPERKPPHFDPPAIVVVIDDMGISLKRTADIASLRAPLTASFLTYGHHLNKQIENSRRAGQEIMIHVPMEAKSNLNEAPDVLTTRMSSAEIKQNLQIMLDKFDGISGANNHMGSKLTEDKERMIAVMETLKQNGLFFLDSKTSASSRAEEAAAQTGIAYAHRHVFIDNNNDKTYILGQLQKAENIARKNGYAIAIGHPKSMTYEALREWLPTLREKNIRLLPLSAVIQVLHPRFQPPLLKENRPEEKISSSDEKIS